MFNRRHYSRFFVDDCSYRDNLIIASLTLVVMSSSRKHAEHPAACRRYRLANYSRVDQAFVLYHQLWVFSFQYDDSDVLRHLIYRTDLPSAAGRQENIQFCDYMREWT